ncbi:hypothetical protein L7F22_007162 [Adiantum nelumboides]|nr:hypothetical protein [Adiantum nelumboides]
MLPSSWSCGNSCVFCGHAVAIAEVVFRDLKHGCKGDWCSILPRFVVSHTPTKTTSHLQKYFIHFKRRDGVLRSYNVEELWALS